MRDRKAHIRAPAPASRSLRRAVLLAGAALLLAAWAGPLANAQARPSESWYGGYSEGQSLAERRAQRERMRNELTARLEPEFRSDTPYVSEETLLAMRAAIDRYRAIVRSGGWHPLPEKTTLRLNDTGREVRILTHHLAKTGDLRTRPRRDWAFDHELQEAVARYQLRNGLRVSGFVDTRTRYALNVPAEQRLKQLELNFERLTELMKINKSERYVLVNVPAFTLQAVDGNQLALESKVVVGKPERETPSVSALIKELNFFPYWRVPDSIAHRDLIPQIRKNPDYFYKEHFSVLPTWGAEPLRPEQINWMAPEIYKYKFRQDPGPNNALGVVRINMPNKHIVYLHDTPLKRLFDQSHRAFSSGCVRVERVLDLAGWLLQGQDDWSPMRVKVAASLGNPEDVKLNKPVPVHFVYVTAWATANGMAHFRPDIYGRDGGADRGGDGDDQLPESRALSP